MKRDSLNLLIGHQCTDALSHGMRGGGLGEWPLIRDKQEENAEEELRSMIRYPGICTGAISPWTCDASSIPFTSPILYFWRRRSN